MNEPIRILMLFTILNRGGAETMVMNYYRNIDRTKVQFDFVVHRPERGAYEDEIEAMGGRIYRMMPLHPLTFGKYKKQISDFFDKHPEYKIIHGHSSELSYFFCKEAKERGIPVIIAHAHNSYAAWDKKLIFRLYFRHGLRRNATTIFTCSNKAAEWLVGKKLAQSAILHRNAIETGDYLYNPQKRREVRKELKIEDGTLLIGNVARFEKQKNHKYLIKTFKEIHNIHPASKLLLVGEGELKDNIIAKAKKVGLQKDVVFLNSRNDINTLLNAFDIFVAPSLGEGFSIATLEAQCSGLRCVVSDALPREVETTDLVTFLPLNKSPRYWADEILRLSKKEVDRTKYPAIVTEAGYDIKKNAEWLQNYYIEQWQKCDR